MPSFFGPLNFDAGGDPSGVVVADFNSDGIPDLAVANDGIVNVLLGVGDGTFQAPRSIVVVGSNFLSVAVGDFNGDGIPDLAVASPYRNNVSVLLGNGDGSFQAAVNYTAGEDPSSVVVGDFNGDGILDLVVANGNYPNGTVNVLLGNGDGSFQPAQSFAAGSEPGSMAVGDFNGDGILDLAVTNPIDSTVSVLLGNGDGSFQPAQSFAAGSYPQSVAVGDFNSDGILDLAVADEGSNDMSVLLGNGDGSFQAARTFSAGVVPFSVVVGDFNGDGLPDLAIADIGDPNSGYQGDGVNVLLGNGDGTFQTPHTALSGRRLSSVAVGDFNGDGILDLAVTNVGGGGSVVSGNGDGSFPTVNSFPTGRSGPFLVVGGDFNGDGIPDLAVANNDAVNGRSISILLGVGDGSFQPPRNFAVQFSNSPNSVAVGDFNGDGIPDLAVANDGTVGVLLGNGDGTFQDVSYYTTGYNPYAVVVGDFNGDGILDIAVANAGTDQSCGPHCSMHLPGSVVVLLGVGDGSFRPAAVVGPEASFLAVGDFSGDGKPDLIFANSNVAPLSILLGNGDGSFQAPRDILPFGSGYPKSLVMGDFNGDGIPDLAVANVVDTTLSILLGNGDGSFQTAGLNLNDGRGPHSLVVGDFNGDGIPDLAALFSFPMHAEGVVRVLLGNGDGTFQVTPISYNAGVTPSDLAVGDFNGDGFPDLAVPDSTSNDVSILINDRHWPPGPGGSPRRHSPARRVTTPQRQAIFPSAFVFAEESPNPTTVPIAFIPAENQPKPQQRPQEIGTDQPAPHQAISTPEPFIAVRHLEDAAFEGWDNSVLEVPALTWK